VLNLMRWGDEIRSWEDLDLPQKAALKENELKMAKQLVGEMAGHWRADEYRDSFRDAIMKLVETKAKAGDTQEKVQLEDAPESAGGGADVIDLTELLKRSLGGGAKSATAKTPARKAAAKKSASKTPAHKTARKTTARTRKAA
jgi:DNA end-binding protein Ku